MHQIANLLTKLGVKKGDRVGIYMSRSLETASAMYGIMAAGALYVPLNPEQPISRNRKLIKDCGIQNLITNTAQKRNIVKLCEEFPLIETIIGTQAEVLPQTYTWQDVKLQSKEQPKVKISPDDLAYILYTSGSTGTPKGIVHSHASAMAYAYLSIAAYDLKSDDIFGNHAPIYFDISTLGYFVAPILGATTIIASEAHVKMPASLSQLIEKEKITVWYSVPLALIQMMQRGALDQRDMSTLRWVIFAGELFPTKYLRVLMQSWSKAKFSNAYGPTETNVCTYYNVPEIPNNDAPISIGKPWAQADILIVNPQKTEVNRGEVGELLVSSPTNMIGYWNNPERNKEAFYECSKNQKSYYCTGDLVRLEAEGNLTFLGRKDRQVKTRGFRVELDEITSVIMKHPRVAEAAVFTKKSEQNETKIMAIIVPKNETSVNQLKAYLKNYLPWYAIPEEILIKADLSRTSTGKIDFKKLGEH